MTSAAAAAGATLEQRDGWKIAVRFAAPELETGALNEGVAWADFSHLRKSELGGQANANLGVATFTHDAWRCPVTADRTLVIGGEPIADALDVTALFGALVVAGPLARETIARFCALDLRPRIAPPGSFLPGSIARSAGFILVEATDRFLVLFGAAYGQYLWEVVSDAGGRLGGRAVGVDTIAEMSTPHA